MEASSFSGILDDMKQGIYNFTDGGKCSNCGSCCTNLIPISGKEIKRIKQYIKKHHIKEQHPLLPLATETLDMSCPFRDEVHKKCLIYEVRPLICRDFKCDKAMKGIKANRNFLTGKYGIIEMRSVFFGGESKLGGLL